uniref:Coatomer subunit zeta n=1 Tax=Ursus maritimus TaxID=29073 RepID=A0A452ULH5_URSMA
MELQEPSLYTIKAVFILDNDGHRLLAKYYDDTFPSLKEQMAFEKNVFNKTSRTDSKCPPLPCPELSDAHRHPFHLDTSVPVSHTYPQAILFSSEVLLPLPPSCSPLLFSGEASLPIPHKPPPQHTQTPLSALHMVGGGLKVDPALDLLTSQNETVTRHRVEAGGKDTDLTEQSVAQVGPPRLPWPEVG